MVFWTLILLVASVVLTELLTPKPKLENARPGGLGDFNFPTATEARAVTLLFGRGLLKGANVTDYGDLRQDAITEKVKTGAFSSKRITTGFRYYLYVQFMLCRGGSAGDVKLRKVRIGETEVFDGTVAGGGFFDIDKPDLLGGDKFGSGGIQSTCDFFSGSKTQAVSTYLNTVDRQQIATAATPTCPRYTGTCYIVAREFTGIAAVAADEGAYLGNNPGDMRAWEFECERFPGIFSGQGAGDHIIDGVDCNPINAVYEAMTDTEWGWGLTDADIGVGVGSTFKLASDTMIAEVNGFSMVIDNTIEVAEFIAEVSRQIDGRFYVDPSTGKWEVQLVRQSSDANWGYNINTVLQLDDDTIRELVDFNSGTWRETTNQVQVQYFERSDDYKETFAPAQSPGNGALLSGGVLTTPRSNPSVVVYPGIKRAANASRVAWRDLSAQARPLVRATYKVNREGYDTVPGKVAAWTDTRRGFDKLAMRVLSVDYGDLNSGTMTITAVEDVFTFRAGSYGNPPSTGWDPPSITLIAYPTAEQFVIEAPRGLVTRDDGFTGDASVAKLLSCARRQRGEVGFEVNVAITPPSAFGFAGDVVEFATIGKLKAELTAGTVVPTASITIETDPDNVAELNGAFDNAITLADLGSDLVHLVAVGNELMLVHTSGISFPDVTLLNVYRGVLGTGQQTHAIATPVFLIFVGGGLSSTNFPAAVALDIELRARTASTTFVGAVNTISLTLTKRALQPYPPSAVFYSGGGTEFTTPDLEADGAGLNGVGFDVDIWRRPHDAVDEVVNMLSDVTPDATTTHRIQIYVDPDGANVLSFDSGWFSGTSSTQPTQAEIIKGGAAGTEIRIAADSRHDILTETNLESFNSTNHDVVPTSSRSGDFFFGGDLQPAQTSNSHTVAATENHTLHLGAAFTSSDVEYRINGGSFVVGIVAGGTSSAVIALTAADTFEIRHTASDTPDPNWIELRNVSATVVAYGAFTS